MLWRSSPFEDEGIRKMILQK